MAKDSSDPKISRWRRPLLVLIPLLLLVAAFTVWLRGGRYQSTENATLQTGLTAISAPIEGTVTAVEVSENQHVAKGQVLFRIDDTAAQVALAEAEAAIASARADAAAKRASYRQSVADYGALKARLAYAQGEAQRQRALLAEGISSRAQFDEAQTQVRTASSAIAAAEAKSQSLSAELAGNIGGPSEALPAVRRAMALRDRSVIRINDTVVRAAQDGVVTKVHQLQTGAYVTPGKPLFLLSGNRVWVTANFKENQLRYMRVGQPVVVTIDAFPDYKIKAHVASFSPGTGSSFSVLPAENATGNWVKVVQRLPVEIALDAVPSGLPLQSGLSAEVTVDTGHQRHLFGPDSTAPAQ